MSPTFTFSISPISYSQAQSFDERRVTSWLYPLKHSNSLSVVFHFIPGFPGEKELYARLGLSDFVQRLLDKRCVTFMGQRDFYLLLSAERCYAGNNYIDVGTPEERPPLVLKDLLSYDEVKVGSKVVDIFMKTHKMFFFFKSCQPS